MKPTHIIWRGLFHLASILSTILVGICFIFHFQSLHKFVEASFANMWLTILGMLLVYLGVIWLTVIVHELGHALAARLVGFRIDLFVIGPLKLMRENDRLRWRVNTSSFAPGFVVATPLVSHQLVSKYALFILGGPLFTLLLAIVSLLICLSLLNQSHVDDFISGFENRTGVYLQLFYIAGYCFLLNCGTLLLCIIPMLVRGKFLNDGGILLWLFQQKKQLTLRDQQLASLGFMMAEGIRPKQWNREELLQCLGTKSLGLASDMHAWLMGYYFFLDCHEIQAAEALLEKALESYHAHSSEVRPSALLESVYFEAFFHNDITQAADYLKLCENNTEVEEPTRLRAEAAVHLAEAAVHLVEKQYLPCLLKAEAALKKLQYSHDRGGSLAKADWIQAIITRCKSSMSEQESDSPVQALE